MILFGQVAAPRRKPGSRWHSAASHGPRLSPGITSFPVSGV